MVPAYEASKAPTKSLFCASMDKLKANKEASWKGLNDTPHELWANYADRGNMTWNQSTSNISETVNSMIGAEVRSLLACFSHNSGDPSSFAQIRVRPIRLRHVPSRV